MRANGIGVGGFGSALAASTRSEVVLLYPSESDPQQHLFARGVFGAGAHGVASTPSGRIVAPMGKHGLLLVGPKEIQVQRARVIKPPDHSLNLYRVICVTSQSRVEVLACAARRSGFLAMPLTGDVLGDTGKSLRSPNADFVDVVSLNMVGHPLAVAILTLDCSIVLVRDLLADDSTAKRLHYGFPGERAYRILCADGHVFLLTNRRLHAFVNLASRFLDGEEIEKQVRVNSWDMEAVDASLASDRSLLVVMPHCVFRIDIEFLVSGQGPPVEHWVASEERISAVGSDGVTTMAMFENPPWEQSDDRELALSSLTAG